GWQRLAGARPCPSPFSVPARTEARPPGGCSGRVDAARPCSGPDSAGSSRRTAEDGPQGVVVHGLGQLVVESRLFAPLVVVFAIAGGGDDDGVAEPGIGAELTGDLVAVHAGEDDVEEHELGAMVAGDLEGLRAVVGDTDVVPGELEQSGRASGHVDVV